MSRDRIIALYDHVPASVTIPTEIGALRPSNALTTWQDDAMAAIGRNERPVLSGDIRSFQEIAREVQKILSAVPEARFALILHWTQALEVAPDKEHLRLFENVYVAIDHAISLSETHVIRSQWWAQWVFVPTSGLCWSDWIPKVLLPQRRGRLLLLAPPSMSVDELRLQISEFSIEHPLIRFMPAPQEWFAPSEIGPWAIAERDPRQTRVVVDQRDSSAELSVIVPFLWSGSARDSERLRTCLKSIAESTKDQNTEIIVSVDRELAAPPFMIEDIRLGIPNFVVIENARRSAGEDWRAGFIQNCAVPFARGNFLLFIDSDIIVTSHFTNWIRKPRTAFDVVQLAAENGSSPGFETASTSLLLVRKTSFDEIGPFAEAFNQYGCEDNLIVWRAQQAKLRFEVLSREAIKHLRESLDTDDITNKMGRLGPSAKLMYRVTLDPRVHAHFYPALGEGVWVRAVFKRLGSAWATRLFLGPIIFLMTLAETEDRLSYLRGFRDFLFWKIKRPVLWFKSQTWRGQRWRRS